MIDFSQLNPDFADKAKQLLDLMQTQGFQITPTTGVRTLEQQDILWRQSRTTDVINAEFDKLHASNAIYLAAHLCSVGPQYGPHVTNAILGYSWHNWGEAMDVLIEPRDGYTEDQLYKAYADNAVTLGLTAGYYFKNFQDMDHVQLRAQEIPDLYTLVQVNAHFQGLESN